MALKIILFLLGMPLEVLGPGGGGAPSTAGQLDLSKAPLSGFNFFFWTV
jgi:hypothetical protein